MKQIYLAGLGIVTVICIIAGCVLNFGGLRSYIPLPGISREDMERSEREETFQNVSSVWLDLDLMDVHVESHRSSEVLVTYSGLKKLEPVWSEDGGNLIIEQKDKDIWVDLFDHKSELVVRIPEGTKLNRLDTEIDMGNMAIENITAGEFNMDIDKGNVELDGVYAKNILADVDMGNLEGDDVHSEELSLKTDMGNIELSNSEFTGFSADASMGSIEVGSVKDLSGYYFDVDTDMGSVTINGKKADDGYHAEGNEGEIRANASMGSIEIGYPSEVN